MVRHIVAWNGKEGISPKEHAANAQTIKQGLEALAGIVPGVVHIAVYTAPLSGSTRALVLNSLFTNAAALAAYQEHPAHKKVGAFIAATMQDRVCLDYEE